VCQVCVRKLCETAVPYARDGCALRARRRVQAVPYARFSRKGLCGTKKIDFCSPTCLLAIALLILLLLFTTDEDYYDD